MRATRSEMIELERGARHHDVCAEIGDFDFPWRHLEKSDFKCQKRLKLCALRLVSFFNA